jgi:hypothetical protein
MTLVDVIPGRAMGANPEPMNTDLADIAPSVRT